MGGTIMSTIWLILTLVSLVMNLKTDGGFNTEFWACLIIFCLYVESNKIQAKL